MLGKFTIRVNGDDVFHDTLPSFKGTKGTAELWIGGYAPQAARFQVDVKDIRIIRIKK